MGENWSFLKPFATLYTAKQKNVLGLEENKAIL
jgi:hypothetical protein